MRIEFRAAWLALLARRTVAGLAGPANPHDRCGLANPETGCSLSCRRARQRGVDYAITQILTVGSRHASPPSLSRQRTRIIRAICESRSESKINEPALAERMIQLSGLRVNRDIEIVFTGMRPGSDSTKSCSRQSR